MTDPDAVLAALEDGLDADITAAVDVEAVENRLAELLHPVFAEIGLDNSVDFAIRCLPDPEQAEAEQLWLWLHRGHE